MDTYRLMSIKPDLAPCQALCYSYDGEMPMKALGSFTAVISANGHNHETTFIVFSGVRDNLLSNSTVMALNLIKLNYSVQLDEYTERLGKRFNKLFSGKIGKLKDFELKLHIDDNVTPVAAKPRQIPYHRLEPVIGQTNKGIVNQQRNLIRVLVARVTAEP